MPLNRTLTTLLLLAACASSPEPTAEEPAAPAAPAAAAAPAHDASPVGYIFPDLDHGQAQSPINILTRDVESGKHTVKLHYETEKESVANLGHTVQVNVADGSTAEFDGQTYAFEQFHFHTPSEHMIDGVKYPLEMHMVHTLPGYDATYFVIGLLFREGAPSPFLDEFMAAIPTEGATAETAGKVDIGQIVKPSEGFYHYQGSLTTSPYTEAVTWAVGKTILEASPEQVSRLNAIEGDNARHVQATNGRVVDEN
jgi:carbonic anhydrase